MARSAVMMPTAKISRVLVAVDFDEASASALSLAGALAAAGDAELTVFHSAPYEVPAYFTPAQIEALEREREESRTAIARELREFAGRHVERAVRVLVGEGPPPDAVLRLAPAFDLVAVGTHRRHGPTRWWLGSVAEAIVRHAPRPILVVPAGATVPATGRAPTILAAGDRASGDAWAEMFRVAFGGSVSRAPDFPHCAPGQVQNADLIVLSMSADDSHAGLGAIVHVLKECVHPVLFVPAADALAKRTAGAQPDVRLT
jgi:universal stress protein A